MICQRTNFEVDSAYGLNSKLETMNQINQQWNEYGEEEEITGALVATRMNKKKAADDAKLLSNRIALLKLEEKKAWKKIEETKKRAE